MSLSLTKRILAGDSQAVVAFYKFYSPRILAYLSKKLPRFEDAEDLVNEVFLEAIDSISMLRQKENVSAWLYRIAHNKMVDFYRKRKIKSILLSQVPFLQIIAHEINEPEFQLEKDALRDRIETALYSLSHNHRVILELHYENELPIKEIAKTLNLSFKATESLLFRARQSFKLAYTRTNHG